MNRKFTFTAAAAGLFGAVTLTSTSMRGNDAVNR